MKVKDGCKKTELQDGRGAALARAHRDAAKAAEVRRWRQEMPPL